MSKRIVPIAYVTKWKGPILVIRGAEATESGHLKRRLGFSDSLFVHPSHWTEDIEQARQRWRNDRMKEIGEAERKIRAARAALKAGPTMEEK